MPSVQLNELTEFTLTPQEKYVAMQLANRELSACYIQNTRVGVFRAINSLNFNPDERDASILAHAYLKGKLEILDELLAGLQNPEQPPVEPANPNQQS